MRSFLKTLFVIVFSLLIYSCTEAPKPIEITGLENHVNPQYKFSIDYPENWESQEQVNGLAVFSIPTAKKRFAKYDALGMPIAKLQVRVLELDSGQTIDSVIVGRQIFGPDYYEKPVELTIDNTKAYSIKYGFELNDGIFGGIMYVALKDSACATIVQFESFGNSFDFYKSKIDSIVRDMTLASTPPPRSEGDTLYVTEELPLPSSKLIKKSGKGYSIKIPDNFSATKESSTSMKYEGTRRGDSYIRVEVLDASKSKNLKKIANQNAKAVGSTAKETRLSGQKSFIVEYNASKEIKRRMYYTIKGDKLYRIVMDWFVGEEKDYLPVFEKSVKTFKLK